MLHRACNMYHVLWLPTPLSSLAWARLSGVPPDMVLQLLMLLVRHRVIDDAALRVWQFHCCYNEVTSTAGALGTSAAQKAVKP